MRPVSPRVGFPEVMVAEDQPEYFPLAAALIRYEDGTRAHLTRWTFSDEDRAKIAAGEDLYLVQLTAGGPMTPVSLEVGRPTWAAGEEVHEP